MSVAMNKIVCFLLLIAFSEFGFGQKPGVFSNSKLKEANYSSHIYKASSTLLNNPFIIINENILQLDSVVTFIFSGTDSVRQYKSMYTYNAVGKISSEVQYYWAPIGNWIVSSKEEYFYDETGKSTITIVYNWNSGLNDWAYKSKFENNYDETGKLAYLIGYKWDNSNNDWIFQTMEDYSYNVAGNRTLMTEFEWNSTTEIWVKFSKKLLNYYGNGKLSLTKSLYWDELRSRWVFVWYDAYEYDKDGKLILEIDYVWNLETGNWIEFEKNENIYDSTGNQVLRLTYFWNDDLFDWKFSSKSFYHTSLHTVGAKKLTNSEIVIYPNPASDFITFPGVNRPVEIKIYTINGRLVKLLQLVQNTADISDLPKGVYMVTIISDDKTVVSKIIKG